MTAYYNEVDAQKAAWIRELIRAGLVAPGEVDERDIREVKAGELEGFRQCHFFAGVAVWSHALRLAGWPDDREAWTGSCPCPSFSAAGKGGGFGDARHRWPDWARLIRERRPAAIFGEQVNDAIGFGWLDLVQADLEAAGYAVGKAVLGACSVGAPHRRQRLYFGAHAEGRGTVPTQQPRRPCGIEPSRETGGRAHADGGIAGYGELQRSGEQRLLAEDHGPGDGSDSAQRGFAMRGTASGSARYAPFASGAGGAGDAGDAGDADDAERAGLEGHAGNERYGNRPGWLDADAARSASETGATRGFWSGCDWWYGRDGKWRPTEPGIFPLAHGAANRVVKLRGYGDAIVPQVAAEFVKASPACGFPRCGQ